MRYLAIDLGGRRTGLAVGDETTGLAVPLRVIETASDPERLRQIAAAVQEHAPDALVVGLPLNMDGSLGPAARKVQQFVHQLKSHLKLPVLTHDERLTSFQADQHMSRSGLTHRRKRRRRDALAATVLLQDFLNCCTRRSLRTEPPDPNTPPHTPESSPPMTASADPSSLPGLGPIDPRYRDDLLDLTSSSDHRWHLGRDGVLHILTPRDRRTEFIVFADKTLALVNASLGPTALYPLLDAPFQPPALAVLMDLDGTSVRSEQFWIWIIQQTIAELMNQPDFTLASDDLPHVSGHSVSEHLQYCIAKYCPAANLQQARQLYYQITDREMSLIAQGRGRLDAFQPAPGLKDFLRTLKSHGIKIGLVTSGLYSKAWPEIYAAFQQMNLGDPRHFYEAIITAGTRLAPGQCGTLGELAPKPHPWLYAETACVGLGIPFSQRHRVIGLEDSGAGVVSIRLAGYPVIGIAGGNIDQAGVRPLLWAYCPDLLAALPIILGQTAPPTQ